MRQTMNRRPAGLAGLPSLALISFLFLLPALLAAAPTSGDLAVDLLPIPEPDLGSLEAAARKKIDTAQSTLKRFMEKGETPRKAMSEGHAFLGQLYHAYGLFDAAEICYRNAQSLAAEDVRWSYLLGLVYNSKGEFENAIGPYQKVLAGAPGDLPTLIRLGNAQVELGRGEEAKGNFERALTQDSTSAAAHYGLGKALALLGEDGAAVERFERALALQPEATVVHYPLGQSYRRLGEMDKATENLKLRGQTEPWFEDPLGRQVAGLAQSTAFEVVLDLAADKESFDEEQFLGFVLSQFGKTQGAVGQLRQGMAKLPESAETATTRGRIHYAIGGLQVNSGQDDAAVASFREAVALAPGLLDARIKLGNAYGRSGNLEEALGQYRTVLSAEPNRQTTLIKLAATLMSLERFDEAKTDLRRVLKLDPRKSEAMIRLAQCHEGLEEVPSAIARYREALALDLTAQERTEVPFRIAMLERQGGNIAAAEEMYRQALGSDDGFLPALSGLASLVAQSGRMEEAATLYNQLARLEPELVAPRLAEATALILSGQHTVAKERLEAGILVFPEEVQLKDILARHLAACPDLSVRDGRRAVELAEQVFNKIPSLESTETLAMAYAEAGRFQDAVEWQTKLLEKVPEDADPRGLERLRGNLALYEAGQRCCAAG